MSQANLLRERRAQVWEQMKEIMDRAAGEARELTGEESASYAKAEADLNSLGESIEQAERHETRAAQLDRIDRPSAIMSRNEVAVAEDRDADYGRAFSSFLRNGMADVTPEERAALRANFVSGSELRAQGVGTASAGGYTVPPGFRAQLIETMKAFGAMLEVAEVITTDSGSNLQWPTMDDTANVGAILAENTQVTEQDVTLGTNSLDAYMYTSKLVRVSLQLLQDSAFNIDDMLRRTLGTRLGRILNTHFTTGTGTAQPDGIVTSSTIGKTGAGGQVTTVIYDDIIDLISSVNPAYRANAQFMMSDTAVGTLRKLKDSTGRPLWEPSLQVGQRDSILGHGIVINQDMPVPAASAKSILFGDFRQAYVIRLVTGVQVLRLDERYADYLQAGFLAFQRADGTLQNASAVRAYAHPAA